MEVFERSEAKVFVIENVPQLLGTFEHGEIVGIAERLGFKVVLGKICAADYGVAQTRIRAVIVGSIIGDPTFLFPPRKTPYTLESLRQSPEHDRQIPDPIRGSVLRRDNYKCVKCGWSHDDWNRSDPRHLELHHKKEHAKGGENTEDNLVTAFKLDQFERGYYKVYVEGGLELTQPLQGRM